MNILNRIKKLESENPNKPPCFCGKTFIDLCYSGIDTDALTYCSHCKDKFDYWQQLAREAKDELSKNLTDGETL